MGSPKKITIKREDAHKICFLAQTMAGLYFEQAGRIPALTATNGADWYSMVGGILDTDHPKEWAAMKRVMNAEDAAK